MVETNERLGLDIYNKRAKNYDRSTQLIERMISKGRNIFRILNGKILEIGVGTGANLKYYNSRSIITALDWSENMLSIARKKIKLWGLTNISNLIRGDVQRLSEYFNLDEFDYVSSTCLFCSVPDPIKGLKQVSKVLKPKGKLIQIEHGISNISIINRGLNILDPITFKHIGSHINRNHLKNLEIAGFHLLNKVRLDPIGMFRLLISEKSVS